MTRTFDPMHSTREEWIANAEHAIRTRCCGWDRVSDDAADWLDADELAYGLRYLRTDITRLIRALEGDGAAISAVTMLAPRFRYWAEDLAAARQRRDDAAETATAAAVETEQRRRETPEAWQQELFRRRRIAKYLTDLDAGHDLRHTTETRP